MTNEHRPRLPALDEYLDADDDRARKFMIHVGERSEPVRTLSAAWQAHLERIFSEWDTSLSDDVWNADDYVGMLFLRDRLDAALRAAPSSLASSLAEWLGPIDGALIAVTEPDVEGLLRRVAVEEPPCVGWWWTRIPIAGPIREDLRRYAGLEPD